MATVYQGRDTRLNRWVAIKILHTHYVHDEDFLLRFQHEAQAAATLNHPNVVSVYDVGQDGDTHYIVMEFVDGTHLKTIINRQAPLNIGYALDIAQAIARGLQAAHAVGMIHRDIKPQNILVTEDGSVRITDFGIAKSFLSTATTQTGVTFGTADYISPEQAQGFGASPRSDIYSLGVTLYEMLTGRLPFTGESPIAVATQHVSTKPPAPTQYNSRIPPQLEQLMIQMLAKDPAFRPTDAQTFIQQLQHYRTSANQATSVSPYSTPPSSTFPPPAARGMHPASAQAAPTGGHVAPGKYAGTAGTAGVARARTGKMVPPPPHSAARQPPPSQSVGCGQIFVGLFILLGVFILVLFFNSGILDSLFVAGARQDGTALQPTLPGAVIDSSPELTSTLSLDTPTPTFTPIPFVPTATPTLQPTEIPTSIPESPTPTAIPYTTVPDITGLPEGEAQQMLDAQGLVPVFLDSRYSDTVPKGAVMQQEVPPQTQVLAGTDVPYIVSLGPDQSVVEIPDVTGLRLERAKKELVLRGLSVKTYEEGHPNVTEGFVIRQEPTSGLRVEQDETVFLAVSVGDKVRIPNLLKKSEDEAKAILESTDGLSWSWSDYQGRDKLGAQYDIISPGTVVSTDPQKDEWVSRGTGVTLGVREYSYSPTTPLVPLP
jgi:serine/threonine-protein kinase